MEENLITSLFLPLALGVIMLGMGMGLTPGDFKRIVQFPKAVLTGLACQMLLLPLLGIGIVGLFGLKGYLAVGLILLAICPGGATSNLVSHLAGADLALSITLTAISSVLCNLSIPYLLNFALFTYSGGAQAIQLPILKTTLQIVAVTLVPVALGMLINRLKPDFTKKMARSVNIISAVFFVLILASAIIKERAHIIPYFQQAGLPALLLNGASMLLAMGVGLVLSLPMRQRITISIETGIQNGTLALGIALSPAMLNQPAAGIPAAIYSLLMFATAILMVFWSRSKLKTEDR